MIYKLGITIFLAFFFTHNLWAKDYIAEAVIVRGNVTVLELGELQAKKVTKGTRFKKDASILTGKRSFIRVQYLDKSTVSLGPKGKMVINQIGKKGVGLISLIKGKLRSKVIKKNQKIVKEKKSHLLFIKTKTASLGVRGTDFQVVYNKTNNATSLLTYEGEVQMAKNERPKSRPSFKAKKDSDVLLERQKELEKVLQSKKSVTVPKGQFSGVTPKLKKTSLPVRISPKQFTVLYKNDELKEASELKETKPDKLLAQADQNAPLEGINNLKTGDYAPRSGGFLDLETGLYVAPGKKSKLNKKLGVYEDKNIGNLSLKTGEYIPPKGLKLDAEKGFVADETVTDPKDIKVREEAIRKLNEDLKTQNDLEVKKVVPKSKVKKVTPVIIKERPKNYKLHPNLTPKKGGYLVNTSASWNKFKNEFKVGGLKNYEASINALSLDIRLSYGLTHKIILGVTGQYLHHTASDISFGPSSELFGKDMELKFKSGLETPVLEVLYKRKNDLFFASFRPNFSNGKDAVIDNNATLVQDGSLTQNRNQLILGYKKTWDKLDNFYSLLFQLEYLGQQIREVDHASFVHAIDGSKTSFRLGFEAQYDLFQNMALRGELGLNIIGGANNRTHNNFVSMIEPGTAFDQKLSLYYQKGSDIFGVSFKNMMTSNETGDGLTYETKTTTSSFGFEYIKELSFNK